MAPRSLLPEDEPIRPVDVHSAEAQQPGAVLATDDRELIREWAARHHAEPATGEATQSGPATIDVQDGGAAIGRPPPTSLGHLTPNGHAEQCRELAV